MAKQNKKLVEQSEALSDFFESLMRDVDAYHDQENSEQLATKKDYRDDINECSSGPQEQLVEVDSGLIAYVEPQAEQNQEAITKTQIKTTEPETKIFTPLPPVVSDSVVVDEVQPVIEVVDTKIQVSVPTSEPVPEIEDDKEDTPSDELPEWCKHEFQAMLFKVAGLTLAVPLIDLNGVVECNLDDISAMPGHADFYFGLMKHLDKNVPLVDTARFVLPADKLTTLLADDPASRITRAVLIQDSQYGLACDEVNEILTLSPEEVRWRSQRTQRRWLAGTVIEHMCALIDATAFAELLAERTPIQAFRE